MEFTFKTTKEDIIKDTVRQLSEKGYNVKNPDSIEIQAEIDANGDLEALNIKMDIERAYK